MDALAFLDKAKVAPQPIYVLAGTERFLKRLVLAKIQRLVLGDAEDDFARAIYEGDSTPLAAVLDDVRTAPFLGGSRLVIVADADAFVTQHREALERYVAKPAPTGVLVLDVKSWKSNTRLAKAVPEAATIKCEAPPTARLVEWCTKWAQAQHGKQLSAPAANLLVELIGPEMGILDQELAKLAAYVGNAASIQAKDVDTLVGHSRVETAWQMMDAVAEGDKAKALTTLEHLFEQGEDPLAILGAMSWQLRRLAQVARLCQQGLSMGLAFSRANVPPFAQKRMEQQLRHLGPRAFQLYDWLLEADLGMKTSGQLPPRTILERLVVKLAEPRPDNAPARS